MKERLGEALNTARDFIEQIAGGCFPDSEVNGEVIAEAQDALNSIASALEAPHSMTEAMIEAGIQALTVLYRGDGGWIGKEAAREQVLRTWNAMQAARPIDQQGTITAEQMRDRLLDGLKRPIAPVQDDDAEWWMELVEPITRAIVFEDCGNTTDWKDNTNLGIAVVRAIRPLLANRLGNQSGEPK